jgi:predicted ATPase
MLLSEVYIKNYRSIEELTLKLGKYSIIVGKKFLIGIGNLDGNLNLN